MGTACFSGINSYKDVSPLSVSAYLQFSNLQHLHCPCPSELYISFMLRGMLKLEIAGKYGTCDILAQSDSIKAWLTRSCHHCWGANQLPLPKDICTGIEQCRKPHTLLDRLEMDPRGFSVIAYSCKVQKRRETISQKIKF